MSPLHRGSCISPRIHLSSANWPSSLVARIPFRLVRTLPSIITGYHIYRHTSLIFCYPSSSRGHTSPSPHRRIIRCIVPASHYAIDHISFSPCRPYCLASSLCYCIRTRIFMDFLSSRCSAILLSASLARTGASRTNIKSSPSTSQSYTPSKPDFALGRYPATSSPRRGPQQPSTFDLVSNLRPLPV